MFFFLEKKLIFLGLLWIDGIFLNSALFFYLYGLQTYMTTSSFYVYFFLLNSIYMSSQNIIDDFKKFITILWALPFLVLLNHCIPLPTRCVFFLNFHAHIILAFCCLSFNPFSSLPLFLLTIINSTSICAQQKFFFF